MEEEKRSIENEVVVKETLEAYEKLEDRAYEVLAYYSTVKDGYLYTVDDVGWRINWHLIGFFDNQFNFTFDMDGCPTPWPKSSTSFPLEFLWRGDWKELVEEKIKKEKEEREVRDKRIKEYQAEKSALDAKYPDIGYYDKKPYLKNPS